MAGVNSEDDERVFDREHRAYLEAVEREARTSCPHCGPEGVVLPVLVRLTGSRVFMCDECEIVWSTLNDVGVQIGERWTRYASRHGLADSWGGLTVLIPT